MRISDIEIMTLGEVESKSGTDKNGELYAYDRLDFVVVGERASRKAYLEDKKLLIPFSNASWGTRYRVAGEVSENGKLTIESAEPVVELED